MLLFFRTGVVVLLFFRGGVVVPYEVIEPLVVMGLFEALVVIKDTAKFDRFLSNLLTVSQSAPFPLIMPPAVEGEIDVLCSAFW